ncbi:hypothetical protein [Rhodoferax sp. GW822-FHT02A01]|uniref:fascin domain-containing protein n=1 Tax=Rhodoferax sp. GW822-FHT02A01 TaxID=3141537 RepID=UPI00315CF32F
MTNLTENKLDDFKNLYPNNPRIQALTLDEVLKNTAGMTVDWSKIKFQQRSVAAAAAISGCQLAVGYVVFDVVCLAVGAVGLRAGVSGSTVQAMANAVAPVLSKIEIIIARLAAQGATTSEIAWGVFEILKTIYSGGCLGAVFEAFTDSLKWWEMVLYGITGVATIVAALATDGMAFVAEIVILLATFGFLLSDSASAIQICNLPPEQPEPGPNPTPGPDPFPFEPVVAIRTVNGHTLTVVNNGGLGGGNVAIQTDSRTVGPWEKFVLVPIDAQSRTFALRTSNGNYVTAVNGGGMGGANDASSPLHTDATWVDSWERLIFEQQADGTYAICTTAGYYLTAVNGGGWGEGANQKPIHTDARALGPWETFSLISVS